MNSEDIVNKLSLIENEIFNPSSDLYLDNLLDLASSISYDIHCSGTWKNSKPIKAFLDRFSNFSEKIYKLRVSLSDFTVIKTVGQGGFGRVDLVRHKSTKNVYAMKIMDKSTFVNNSFNGFWEERDIMAKNSSDWLIKCFYTFMDLKKLYIVMEYMPGGDLYHWMTELEDFSDEQTHFYAMELVLAVEVLHNMGFIHRDLKPDNMLLDKNGHMKLADFGTCIRTRNGKVKTNFQVGTPDYICPEILRNTGIHDLEVGFETDWWAFGIVIYELFYGETPFEGESTSTLYQNIMRYKSTLIYPDDKPAKPELIDFMSKILTEPTERMDITGIKSHPYLVNSEYKWNFNNIREHQSPVIFEVSGEDDTNYIAYDPNDRRNNISNNFINNNYFSGENLAFSGFTFNRFNTYNFLAHTKGKSTGMEGNISNLTELEMKLSEAALAKQQLSLKLDNTTNELGKTQQKLSDALRELKDREQLINTNKSEYESSVDNNKLLKSKIENITKQIESSNREIEQLKSVIGEKENLIKSLKTENCNLSDEISSSKINLSTLKQNLSKAHEEIEEKGSQIDNMKKINSLFEEEKSKNQNLINEINTKTRKINEFELQLELISSRAKDSVLLDSNSQSAPVKSEDFELLQKEKQALESRLISMMNDLSSMEEEKNAFQQDLNNEKIQKSELETIRDKLSKDVTNQKLKVSSLQNRLNAAEDQKRVLNQRINMIESEKDQIEQQKKMFESMVEVRKMELDEIVAQHDEQEECFLEKEKKFENDKKFLETTSMNISIENDRLKAELVEVNKKLEELKLIECENGSLSQINQKLKTDLEEKKQQIMDITKLKINLTNDLDKVQKELDSDKLKIKSLVTKIDEMMTNPKSMPYMSSRKKKEKTDNDATRKVRQLETELSKEKAKFQEKLKECNDTKNECQSWQDQCKELKSELENKNNIIKDLMKSLNNDMIPKESPSEELSIKDNEMKSLEGKLEMLKKGKGKHKISWLPYFGVLKPFKLELYQGENDNVPFQSIDLRSVMHIREPSAAECLHVDKHLLPQILQIIYQKQDAGDDFRRQSVISVDTNRRYKGSTLTVDDGKSSLRSSIIVQLEGSNGPINVENHSFVPMRFRSITTCDLCHQSCSDWINPPAALECGNCKKRIHQEHLLSGEFKIQWCPDAIEIVLFKVESKEAKNAWISCLNSLKDYQKTNEVQIAPNTYYRSVRVPGRHSPAI